MARRKLLLGNIFFAAGRGRGRGRDCSRGKGRGRGTGRGRGRGRDCSRGKGRGRGRFGIDYGLAYRAVQVRAWVRAGARAVSSWQGFASICPATAAAAATTPYSHTDTPLSPATAAAIGRPFTPTISSGTGNISSSSVEVTIALPFLVTR